MCLKSLSDKGFLFLLRVALIVLLLLLIYKRKERNVQDDTYQGIGHLVNSNPQEVFAYETNYHRAVVLLH